MKPKTIEEKAGITLTKENLRHFYKKSKKIIGKTPSYILVFKDKEDKKRMCKTGQILSYLNKK